MQIKAFENILEYFQNKSETDFIEKFELEKTLSVNFTFLVGDFSEAHFTDVRVFDDKEMEELETSLGHAIFPHYLMEMEVYVSDDYEEFDTEDSDSETKSKSKSEWNKFLYGPIRYSANLANEKNRLDALMASPFLPTNVIVNLK